MPFVSSLLCHPFPIMIENVQCDYKMDIFFPSFCFLSLSVTYTLEIDIENNATARADDFFEPYDLPDARNRYLHGVDGKICKAN